MSNPILNLAARRETVRTLAANAGIGENSAAELLNRHISLTTQQSNSAAQAMADELELILARTFTSVSRTVDAGTDLNIIIGTLTPKFNSNIRTLFATWNDNEIVVSTSSIHLQSPADQHPLFLLVGSCYLAAAATKILTGNAIVHPLPDPLIISFDELGVARWQLTLPIDFSDTYMAGAGAIGNGVLRALRHLNVRGQLDIADNDIVDDTNLQRQLYFGEDDIGKPKATTLVQRAQSEFCALKLIAHDRRLQELRKPNDPYWLKRLIVCVDSRRARRELQDEIAGEVFDASTTDIREVIVHYHKQPTTAACMSCIYFADHRELQRENLLATGLGLSIDQVRQPMIDLRAARSIARHLALDIEPERLVGLACDTLFKQLCGEGLLRASPDKQILAPFAFVSLLAGVLLAIEVIRRLTSETRADDNYWRVSAWSPPIFLLRRRRPRNDNCTFCSKSYLIAASRQLWAENIASQISSA